MYVSTDTTPLQSRIVPEVPTGLVYLLETMKVPELCTGLFAGTCSSLSVFGVFAVNAQVSQAQELPAGLLYFLETSDLLSSMNCSLTECFC